MYPDPFFHEPSGALRFWVLIGDGSTIGASISKEALHYRFKGDLTGADAVQSYNTNRLVIDEAVKRRVAKGSIEPVMLRERDVAEATPR